MTLSPFLFLVALPGSPADAVLAPADLGASDGGIRWRGWSDSLFEDARRENRLVLLDLEAVWCHWCHVIDKHLYARENGWAIEALALHARAAGEKKPLDAAVRAVRWIVEHRSLAGGGFRHGEEDSTGPHFADTLAMAEAFWTLHRSTREREWLDRASAAARFLEEKFLIAPGSDEAAGFATSVAPREKSNLFPREPQRDENIHAARFFHRLFSATADPSHRRLAGEAMRYLAATEIARRRPTGGALLAGQEVGGEPIEEIFLGGVPKEERRP